MQYKQKKNKNIEISLYLNLFLFSIIGYSQSVNDKLKYIKRYAYCDCVFINNNKLDVKYLNDTFQISDKSSNQLLSLGKISEQQSKSIRDFTEKMAGNFYAIESSYYSETGTSNTITSMCLDFYESKDLDVFSRKFVDPKKTKK